MVLLREMKLEAESEKLRSGKCISSLREMARSYRMVSRRGIRLAEAWREISRKFMRDDVAASRICSTVCGGGFIRGMRLEKRRER